MIFHFALCHPYIAGFYPDKSLMCADIDAVMDMMDDLRKGEILKIAMGSGEEKASFKELQLDDCNP